MPLGGERAVLNEISTTSVGLYWREGTVSVVQRLVTLAGPVHALWIGYFIFMPLMWHFGFGPAFRAFCERPWAMHTLHWQQTASLFKANVQHLGLIAPGPEQQYASGHFAPYFSTLCHSTPHRSLSPVILCYYGSY